MKELTKLLTHDEMECLDRASIQLGHFKGMVEDRISRACNGEERSALKDIRLLADQIVDTLYRLKLKEYMRG